MTIGRTEQTNGKFHRLPESSIKMSLYGATTPADSHPCFDRLVILVEPGGKASHEVPGILTTQLL